MAEVARPGMGQDEKDRIGQAEMRQRRIEAGEINPDDRSTWTPDDQLDGFTKDALLDEAGLRGVDVAKSATKPEVLAALRGRAAVTSDGAESEEAAS